MSFHAQSALEWIRTEFESKINSQVTSILATYDAEVARNPNSDFVEIPVTLVESEFDIGMIMNFVARHLYERGYFTTVHVASRTVVENGDADALAQRWQYRMYVFVLK